MDALGADVDTNFAISVRTYLMKEHQTLCTGYVPTIAMNPPLVSLMIHQRMLHFHGDISYFASILVLS